MAEGGVYYLRSFTNDGDLEKENNKQEILSHEDEEEVKNTEHPKITEVKKQREKIAQGDAVDEVVMTGSDATSTCRRKVGSRNDGLDDEAIKSPQRNTSQQNLTVQKELYQGRSSVSDSRLTTVPKVTAVPDQIEDNYPISRKGKNLTQSQIYLNPRQEPGRPIPGVIGNGTNHFYGIPDPDRHDEYIPRHPQRQFIQGSSNNHCEFIRASGDHHIQHSEENNAFEPRPRLPTFNGKGDWKSFWVQFQFLSQRCNWDENRQLGHLVSCIQDEAMEYVSRLPVDVRSRLPQLVNALERRFGDYVLPETHRASLQSIKKNSKETLQEYSARVHMLMIKAYPGLEGSKIFVDMTIEHLVNGLADPNLIYDVMTKKPTTVEQALDMIQWHECCKGISRRKLNVRQVTETEEFEKEILNVNRVNGKRFVTEERLQQFGRELKESIIEAMTAVVSKQNLSNTAVKNETGNRMASSSKSYSKQEENVICYNCHQKGHYAKFCSNRRPKDRRIHGTERRTESDEAHDSTRNHLNY